MHPIERLRSVARAQGAGPSLLVREAAGALAGLGGEPTGLVTACRRLVDRHPTIGPMWAMASRVLTATEPVAEAWEVADELDEDTTSARTADALPDDGTVLVVGWPEQAAVALERRADLEVLVVDCAGEARGLSQRLRRAGVECTDVPDAGLGAAVGEADLVLLEALSMGSNGFVAASGSNAAAVLGRSCEVAVWVMAGESRVLPTPLWDALLRHLRRDPADPWDRPYEPVPLSLCERVAGPAGGLPPAEVGSRGDFAVAAELLKPLR